MKDLKYLAAYIAPIVFFTGLYFQGWVSWSTVVFAYVIVPLIDQFGHASKENLNADQVESKLSNKIFDILLYINLPIVYGSIAATIYVFSSSNLTQTETIGTIISLGILISTLGINVGHELGHRETKFEQTLSKLLYLPSHYIHFFIEHNRGHHKNVSTPIDPATAKKNQPLYAFWFQSVVGGYENAWKLENDRLTAEHKSVFSWDNQMIRFTIYQMIYWLVIFLVATPLIGMYIMISGVISFLLLETINYIEHYGLQRKLLPSGRYERVLSKHSWNANYPFGRIILYELTRHSDHHYLASKKYQILDHHDDAPELPFGYPMSMLIATIPPLWYSIMNPRLPEVV